MFNFKLKIIIQVLVILFSFYPSQYSFSQAKDSKEVKPKQEKPVVNLYAVLDIFSALRFNEGAKKELNIGKWAGMYLNLLGVYVDASYKNYGIHIQFTINNWTQYMEQGYFYAKIPIGESQLKIGIIRVPFGLHTDNTWVLSNLYYAGLTYDTDYGIVYEGKFTINKHFNIQLSTGYFLISNGKNGSFYGGPKDTTIEISYEERDSFAGRLAAEIHNKHLSLTLGSSVTLGDVGIADRDDSKYFMYEIDLNFKWHLGKLQDFIWIIAEYVNADIDKKKYTNLSNYEAWMIGFAIKPIQNARTNWLNWINFHVNYSVIDRKNGEATDFLVVGPSIGFSKYFIFTVELGIGRKDTSRPLRIGNNRYDETWYADLIYLINF